jgi:hypothetical protein
MKHVVGVMCMSVCVHAMVDCNGKSPATMHDSCAVRDMGSSQLPDNLYRTTPFYSKCCLIIFT